MIDINRLLFVALLSFWAMSSWPAPAFSQAPQACPVPGAPTTPLVVQPFTGTPPQGGPVVDCTGTPPPPPPPVVNGVCGSDDGMALSSPPTNLCSAGTATPVTGTGPWSWSCLGSGIGATDAVCSATLAVGPPPPPPPPPGTTITMGETTVFSTTDNDNANSLLTQDMTLSQSSTLQSISMYFIAAVGSVRYVLYDDSNNIVVQTPSFTPVVGWNLMPVGHVALSPGRYWGGYEPSNDGLSFPVLRQDGLTCRISYLGSYRAAPAVYPSFRTDRCHWSFYVTLSVP